MARRERAWSREASARPRSSLSSRAVPRAPIGAEVDLTNEFDGNVTLRLSHWRVVLRNAEHVLVFHQNTNMGQHLLGTFSGFTLERGDAVCSSPEPNAESRCADSYHHQLVVTVSGGMAATVTSWEGKARKLPRDRQHTHLRVHFAEKPRGRRLQRPARGPDGVHCRAVGGGAVRLSGGVWLSAASADARPLMRAARPRAEGFSRGS